MASIIRKGTHIQGLSWVPKDKSISAPAHDILKALISFSHVYHPDGFQTTLLAQGCVLAAASGAGEDKWDAYYRQGEG